MGGALAGIAVDAECVILLCRLLHFGCTVLLLLSLPLSTLQGERYCRDFEAAGYREVRLESAVKRYKRPDAVSAP